MNDSVRHAVLFLFEIYEKFPTSILSLYLNGLQHFFFFLYPDLFSQYVSHHRDSIDAIKIHEMHSAGKT